MIYGVAAAAQVRGALLRPEKVSESDHERTGYFAVGDDSQPGALVFNRTVSLRDTWAKVRKKG